jgi:hypothetical protein
MLYGWTVSSLDHSLVLDELDGAEAELDDAYVEVVVDHLPPALEPVHLRVGCRNSGSFTSQQQNALWLDLSGRLVLHKGTLQFDTIVLGFKVSVGDVIGIGVDNEREVYVTQNGRRLAVRDWNGRVTWLSADCQVAVYKCADEVQVRLNTGRLYDPQRALRSPLNCPWRLEEGDDHCAIDLLPAALIGRLLCEYVLEEGPLGVVALMRVCKRWNAAIQRQQGFWRAVYAKRFEFARVNGMHPSLGWHTLLQSRRNRNPREVQIENCDRTDCPLTYSLLNDVLSDDSCRHCSICDCQVYKSSNHRDLMRLYQNAQPVKVALALRDLYGSTLSSPTDTYFD